MLSLLKHVPPSLVGVNPSSHMPQSATPKHNREMNKGVETVVALGARAKEFLVTPEKREREGRASWVLDVDIVSSEVSSFSYGGVASSRS